MTLCRGIVNLATYLDMFLLNKLGYDFKNIENGTIPYEAALSLSGLDEQDRSYLLDEIQANSA
jgi:hypothetical protein